MSNETENTEQVNQIQTAPPRVEMSLVGELNQAGIFDLTQRKAKLFASSDIVPKDFKGNMANCFIALEMAERMGAGEMAVMQNLHIIHGKPGWSATFIIAGINSCGKFSPLRYEFEGEGDTKKCRAWARDLNDNEKLYGSWVGMEMAKAEGWSGKTGSKWKTMPDQMMMYRAATFFGRAYAPELLMGLQSDDEIRDVGKGHSEYREPQTVEKVEEKTIEKPKKPRKPRTTKPKESDVVVKQEPTVVDGLTDPRLNKVEPETSDVLPPVKEEEPEPVSEGVNAINDALSGEPEGQPEEELELEGEIGPSNLEKLYDMLDEEGLSPDQLEAWMKTKNKTTEKDEDVVMVINRFKTAKDFIKDF